jgi:hypothetical protein
MTTDGIITPWDGLTKTMGSGVGEALALSLEVGVGEGVMV